MMNLHDPIAVLLGSWAAEINVWSALLRIALAILCSAIIGCERATKRHAAGLRTFMLACLASAIAMMVDQSLGGSIPIISDFERELGVKTILMGFGLESNAIHSPNENCRLDIFRKGIVAVVEALR